MNLDAFEKIFEAKIATLATPDDPAHDLLHFKRVVKTAKQLCKAEGAKLEVVIPAAWLHDFVNVPKNDPRRSQASKLSADAAEKFLISHNYPSEYFKDIKHAIEAHSYSANIEASSLEAKIVQDADRLDGLGAIGIARCFSTGGSLKRLFYSEQDPFAQSRTPDDMQFTVDHFFVKLFKVVSSLQTREGKAEGERRLNLMKQYLSDLKAEI